MKTPIRTFCSLAVLLGCIGTTSIALAQDYDLVINGGRVMDPETGSFDRSVRTAENFEPAIPHPEQQAAVKQSLADLKSKFGKRPNIVWLIVDDMGFGDPGCYGGGAAIGAATPNIDKLASEGLKLTSCYAQQTCTPTRSI